VGGGVCVYGDRASGAAGGLEAGGGEAGAGEKGGKRERRQPDA
jgi:hypothetical protein